MARLAADGRFDKGAFLIVESGNMTAAALLEPGPLFPVLGVVGDPFAGLQVILGRKDV
jgi:hypothetical protein